MASLDITFCMNKKCNITKCIRNPKRIKVGDGKRFYSFAYLEDTEDCMKKKEVGGMNDTMEKG